jgi:hypothetical protein
MKTTSLCSSMEKSAAVRLCALPHTILLVAVPRYMHIYMDMYIYICICVCVCLFVCVCACRIGRGREVFVVVGCARVILQVLGDRKYNVIIADESHYLKSPDAKRTQVIYAHAHSYTRQHGVSQCHIISLLLRNIIVSYIYIYKFSFQQGI